MRTKTMGQLVADLRNRAEELESRAGHLKQTADFLSREYGLDAEPTEQTTDQAPSNPEKPGSPKLILLRCTGSKDRPDCANMVKSPRRRKDIKCKECRRLLNNARARKNRARMKKSAEDTHKTVWHGEEGLSSGAPSSIGRDQLERSGV
ncbi:MAG: hypothetical protein OXI69_15370 [Acidobacteriota bacterium]|nr:hypothetical protein [Acidobacteriota bacterium]